MGPTAFGKQRRSADLATYYDDMFAERRILMPDALTLEFWQEHFILRAARQAGITRGRLVDIACGTGEVDIILAREQPDLWITGIDISPTALRIAERHKAQQPRDIQRRLTYDRKNIEETGLPQGGFEAALFSHTLEHLANPAPVLREIARVVRPGGLCLVIVPIGYAHDDPDHKRHLDVNGYVKLLSRYGEIAKAWASEEGDQAAYMVALRRAPRILAAARVRNEEENLPAFFREVSEVADGVVILDDRSTDRTASLCAKEDLVVEYLRSDLPTTDEVRDKNRLLASVIEHDPDWVVAIDADERFEPGGAAYVKRLLTYAPPEATAYSFDAVHLWDTPVQARIDGLYGSSVRHPRVFHTQPVVDGALRFRASAHDAGLHCGSIPSDLAADAVPTPVRLLHLGYLDEHTREAKVAFYQREDPGQFAAGYYSHLSDASAQLVHILDRREALERAELWHSINHGVNLGRFASLAVLFVHADVEPSIAQAIRQQRPRYLVQIGGTSPHIWADAVYPNLREAMNAVEAKAFCVPLNLAASALTAAVRAGFPTTGVLALGQGRWSRRLASVVSRVRMQHRSDGGE